MKSSSHPRPVLSRLGIAAMLVGLAATLGACKHTEEDITASTAPPPNNYRLRHPIVVEEKARTIDVFVGSGRGGLTASQRTDVTAFAQSWLQEGTGPLAIDLPIETRNARAATQSLHDIRGIFSASGIPARGITIRRYTPEDPAQLATIKLNYPKITADAGPCGLWPDDLGPTIKSKIYQTNSQHWNHGCASQRNLAAMVANPTDLVQPRPESPSYTTRRGTVLTKHSKGESTATQTPEIEKAKLSDVGK